MSLGARPPGFRFTLSELSGALADLGVMLPLVVALITLNGLNASSAFVVIGFAYLVNALVYRLPVPVQPLKSLAATALALGLGAPVVTAGAWWMAAVFLLLALTGVVAWVGRFFPMPVVRGIQVGLGLLLLRSAWGLVSKPGAEWTGSLTLGPYSIPVVWAVAGGAALVLLVSLWVRPGWAALAVIVYGLALTVARMGWPEVRLALTLPALVWPRPSDFAPAFWLLALPQIPLSLANSVFATSEAARQYFGPAAAPVTPRRLLTTMGLVNVTAALFGGVPLCHGSGGLTAHYRLGARTGGALLMIGAGFLVLGFFGGASLLPVLGVIPYPALGVLLAYIGVQHMLLAKDLRGWPAWTTALIVAAAAWLTPGGNLAWGFAAGAAFHFGWMWKDSLAARHVLDLPPGED